MPSHIAVSTQHISRGLLTVLASYVVRTAYRTRAVSLHGAGQPHQSFVLLTSLVRSRSLVRKFLLRDKLVIENYYGDALTHSGVSINLWDSWLCWRGMRILQVDLCACVTKNIHKGDWLCPQLER